MYVYMYDTHHMSACMSVSIYDIHQYVYVHTHVYDICDTYRHVHMCVYDTYQYVCLHDIYQCVYVCVCIYQI